MGKAVFTKGFAKERIAEGRSPIIARIDTGETILDLEASFPKDRAWKVFRFISNISDERMTPQEAFDKAFTSDKREKEHNAAK